MDLTGARPSELLPRLEDLVRDGIDEPDGRERAPDDGADARHEVVPLEILGYRWRVNRSFAAAGSIVSPT